MIGWLRVSAKPLKQALATVASKWVYLFTRHLQDRVTGAVTELGAFMDGAEATLARRVLGEGGGDGADGDQPGAGGEEAGVEGAEAGAEAGGDGDAAQRALYAIMTCMRDVRKRGDRTDASFEPLRATVAALQAAGTALPEGVLRQVCGLRRAAFLPLFTLSCGVPKWRIEVARACSSLSLSQPRP